VVERQICEKPDQVVEKKRNDPGNDAYERGQQ
jgi:hypothetical protein